MPDRRSLRFLILALLLVAAPRLFAASYASEVETARRNRVEALAQPYGWLTLIGHYPLSPGRTTVGRAATNTIRLTSGPAQFGELDVRPNGEAIFTATANAGILVDGQPANAPHDLHAGHPGHRPTLVSAGTIAFYVVNSDAGKILHVRDTAAPALIAFEGIPFYRADPSWRIEATWLPEKSPQAVSAANQVGGTSPQVVAGQAVFQRDGRRYALEAFGQPDGRLLFVIADATSGDDTYAMRFLEATPREDQVVLDFNFALNPPCAFTAVAVCPLPPASNRLPFAIRAGEKTAKFAPH